MESQIRKNLAYHLKVERAKKDLTQEKLAELTGISPKHITKIEAMNVTPSVYLVYKIAKVFNTTVDRLISDADD